MNINLKLIFGGFPTKRGVGLSIISFGLRTNHTKNHLQSNKNISKHI